MWRVFWVGADWWERSGGSGLVGADFEMREGDAVFVAPDYRIDPVLCRYGQSAVFRGYTAETRRNYSCDLVLLLTFLWSRGRHWSDARDKDLEDFKDWRFKAPQNPGRVGASKSNRELAAFVAFFKWAKRKGYVTHSPVAVREVVGREGEVREVPAGLEPVKPASGMHWLTPRAWRLWIAVGLCGHDAQDLVEPGWMGRLEDRNVAFTRLVVSSGLRRQEAGALLTFEVPATRLGNSRYCFGRLAAESTRAKAARTYYASTESARDIESYADGSRAWAVSKAQLKGRYDRLAGMRLVIEVTPGPRRKVRWVERDGTLCEQALDRLTWQERTLLFTEGPLGPEPMWLWLNEAGLPFHPHSWEAVFRAANLRCRKVLAPPKHERVDPHKVYWPHARVHAGRHSFALKMLVTLNEVLDRRFGLTARERRHYGQLLGDPWQMVQGLLGHATRQITVDTYLAPVRHLDLASLLREAEEPAGEAVTDLDGVFAKLARESEGIQDIDVKLTVKQTGGRA
ncbi:Tyrosine recombinase XerC [Streptomyces sp. PTY087I2]|nr:Tyrosine recombinase XerC [Streptomyces sp. PTY087I2]